MARRERGTFLISSGNRVIHRELSGSLESGLLIILVCLLPVSREEEEQEKGEEMGEMFVVFTKRCSR